MELTDVSLRDGLQMVPRVLSTEEKLGLFESVLGCGFSRIEVTSFVHPKWMPQFADSEALCKAIFARKVDVPMMAFVPNLKGLERMLSYPIDWASCFVATSETFNQKNVNASIQATLEELAKVRERAHKEKRKLRVYVSTAFGCPFEGMEAANKAQEILKAVAKIDPDEIAPSDTIGVAVPSQVSALLTEMKSYWPLEKTALHFHNTYGNAAANVRAAMDVGVRKYDGAIGGVGGCPYAKGASGNFATEDLHYLAFREGWLKAFPTQAYQGALQKLRALKLAPQSQLGEIFEAEEAGMASNNLLIERKKNGIVVATINRPDRLNALNKDVLEDLTKLLDVLETEKTARVIILTAGGDKAFCVGADLKERRGMNEKDTLLRLEYVHRLYDRLERSRFPIIAAINGMALGGGLELALACDLRVASDSATFGFPETGLAIIPGNGGTQRVTRVIGMGHALELILLAKRLNAHEALGLGLINAVVPPDRCLGKATSWAEKMLEAGPIALAMAKRAVRGGADVSLKEGIDLELECYKKVLYSKDRQEGLRAFEEKRAPQYVGE